MESYRPQSFAQELVAMEEADQQMRMAAIQDESQWDETVDRNNNARLKEIIAAIGWPTISKVGEKASSAAWLLIQHAPNDLAFMKECLRMMKEVTPGDVSPANIAFLEDRILVFEGEHQIYGTQFRRTDSGNFEVCPIADPEHVDARRKAVGLDTLAENTERIREMYKAPAE